MTRARDVRRKSGSCSFDIIGLFVEPKETDLTVSQSKSPLNRAL